MIFRAKRESSASFEIQRATNVNAVDYLPGGSGEWTPIEDAPGEIAWSYLYRRKTTCVGLASCLSGYK